MELVSPNAASEPDPPVLTAQAAATALCEYFLANADRDDNAANDDLVAELVDRIRARRHSPSLPVRTPGAHLHPQLRRPPSAAAKEGAADETAQVKTRSPR